MALRGAFDDLALPAADYLPVVAVTTTAQASGVAPVAGFAGAQQNVLVSSAATALTTPTAAQIYAQFVSALQLAGLANPGQNTALSAGILGSSYIVEIVNSDASGLTLTAGTGVTFVGTNVIAAAAGSRTYAVNIVSPTVVTMTSIGSGGI